MYKPQPLETNDVELPPELEELADFLARNVHETWAKERMAQGWKYGNYRNDKEKLHPSLVPFEELSEKEKKFDYLTAINTIKVLLKLGYTIEKNQ